MPYLTIMIWIILSIVLLVGFFVIFRKIRDKNLLETVTKSNRGTRTERDLVLKLLKHGIPAKSIFHDLYVEKRVGEFSQIDLVVAAKTGIIVFEVKDYSGWIFGNGQHREWTQVLAYGQDKYRFYNPIMQNNKHIGELRKKLKQFANIPFYSVVVFYGDCVLKDINFVPDGTFLVKSARVLEVLDTILIKNDLAPYTDKFEVVRVLKEAVYNGKNKAIQTQHKENIKDMLGKHRISN
jgi:Nuclease-related domain